MTQEQTKETFNQIVDQGKSLVEKGNQRHVVVRDESGKKLVDVTGTVAVVVMVALLLLQPLGGFIIAGSLIYGVVKKLKVELLRNVGDEDTVVEVQLPQEEI